MHLTSLTIANVSLSHKGQGDISNACSSEQVYNHCKMSNMTIELSFGNKEGKFVFIGLVCTCVRASPCDHSGFLLAICFLFSGFQYSLFHAW